MSNAKLIRARIKSVKNTSKITRAMELISTVKMKKAQDSVHLMRPFALEALRLMGRIGHTMSEQYSAPANPTNRELLIVVSSHRGLCGGYNINTFKQISRLTRENPTIQYDYLVIGKKVRDFIIRSKGDIIDDLSAEIRETIDQRQSRRVSRTAIRMFETHQYDAVRIIYSHYMSVLVQRPIVKTLLPISYDQIVSFLTEISHPTDDVAPSSIIYEPEPEPEIVFNSIVPMIIDSIVFETLLEAKASEHSARMIAMKNAKDNALKKVGALTLSYNKARQAAITKEVTEIVSGVESMKEE